MLWSQSWGYAPRWYGAGLRALKAGPSTTGYGALLRASYLVALASSEGCLRASGVESTMLVVGLP